MIQRACTDCGRAFTPQTKIDRRCPEHTLHGRGHRSPTTRAQDAEYARNRRTVLAGHPTCALRIRCDGATATTADHIAPVANGGTNQLDNLQPACLPCNTSKGGRPESLRPSPAQDKTHPYPPPALRLS